MTAGTRDVAVGYLGLVGFLAVLAALGVRCATAVRTGVVVAEIVLLALASFDVVAHVRGHRPPEPVTHLGYVVVSVLLIPLLVGRRTHGVVDGEIESTTRTDYVIVALGCGVAIVVVARMYATWN